jgi:hypothetical protein
VTGVPSGGAAGGTAVCSGWPDFTPCSVVTTPDRKYDVCMGETCVSPGCGDASCNVSGPHFPLADTNQRSCYAERSSEITCPTVDQSLYGQDAQYGWDVLHAADERYLRSLSNAAEPLVIDNATGLTWQGCPAGLSGSDCATGTLATYLWQDALAYCDSLNFGGYQDWHLPDPYELDSINDFGTIDQTAFPTDTGSGKDFWSSTSEAAHRSFAFTSSYTSLNKEIYDEMVRCVRGGTPPTSLRFTRNTSAEPVVVDNTTGLTWQGCVAGLTGSDCATGSATIMVWADGLAYCEGLSWAGQSDWRVPNRKELASIVDSRRTSPAIDLTAFPATPSNQYQWSSSSWVTSCSGTDCRGCYVSFIDGHPSCLGPKLYNFHLRCVRGGT